MFIIEPCQGSGVGSIPIGRSIISTPYSNCILERGTTKDQLLFLPPAESIQPTSDVLPVSPVSKPVRKRPASICCLRAASVLGQFLRPHRRLSRALRKSCGRNAIPEPW